MTRQTVAWLCTFGMTIAGCGSRPVEEQPSMGSNAATVPCDPKTENCCPATGVTEQALTNGPDVFSSAQPNLCVRGRAGNDTIMLGPRGYAIGGPGDDTINAYDHGTVVPGPGADIVSISQHGTVDIFDVCEVSPGENLFGGGDGTLVTPVPVSQLTSRGASINGFSSVVVQKNSCKSSCVVKPGCSGHGQCAEGASAGQVVCACDPGFQGADCSIAIPVPEVACVTRFDATHLNAFFGYNNTNATSVSIPIGSTNRLTPASSVQPPTTFAPGHTAQAFMVSFGGGTVSWTLGPKTVVASASSPPCPGTVYPEPAQPAIRAGIIDPISPSALSAEDLAKIPPNHTSSQLFLWPQPPIPPTAQFPDPLPTTLADEDVGEITCIDLAYEPRLCATWKASFVDSGVGEDFGNAAASQVQELPAAFATAKLDRNGFNLWNGTLDADGCIPTGALAAGCSTSLLIVKNVTPPPEFVLTLTSIISNGSATWTVWSETGLKSQDALPTDFGADDRIPLARKSAAVMTLAIPMPLTGFGTGPFLIPPPKTTVTSDQFDDLTRTSAVIGQILRTADNGVAAGAYRVMADDGCNDPVLKFDSCYSPADDILYIGPAVMGLPSQAQWKYITAHEAGHYIQNKAMVALKAQYEFTDPSTQATLNDPPNTPSLCKCEHVTTANKLHCLQSIERNFAAQLEGWAQFYSSKTWNAPDEGPCVFNYYKEFLDPSCPAGAKCTPFNGLQSIFPPVARTCKDAVKWRNNHCGMADFATEYDWMGFLWNLNTSTANKFAMSEIYSTYITAVTKTPTWPNLQTAAETTFGATSAKATYFKSTGAQFGVDTNTAP